MHVTFAFAGVLMLVAAAASWMRGSRYIHVDEAPAPLSDEEVRPPTGAGVAPTTGE